MLDADWSIDRCTGRADRVGSSEHMKNVNATPLDSACTSIFIAHHLRTVVEAGETLRHFICIGDELTALQM